MANASVCAARWAGAWLLLAAAGCGTTYPLDGWQISPVESAGSSGRAGRDGGVSGRAVPIAGAVAAGGRSAATAGRGGSAAAGTGGRRPAAAGRLALRDRDRDGFPEGSDCDDNQPAVFPGAPDSCCDSVDQDCDGSDAPRGVICACSVVNDLDGDGYPNDVMGPKLDCDDSDPSIHPGAPESCFDGRDNNCNGLVDREEKQCWIDDLDGDGSPSAIDCNDFDASIHPGAVERCGDKLDNDCDGSIDQGCAMPIDFDRDGFAQDVDCNDWDNRTYPGSSDETCCDSVDSDCDGQDDPRGLMCNCADADNDGFPVGGTPAKADCNDQNPSVFPGASEICSDGIDNDCDRRVDFDDSECRLPI